MDRYKLYRKCTVRVSCPISQYEMESSLDSRKRPLDHNKSKILCQAHGPSPLGPHLVNHNSGITAGSVQHRIRIEILRFQSTYYLLPPHMPHPIKYSLIPKRLKCPQEHPTSTTRCPDYGEGRNRNSA